MYDGGAVARLVEISPAVTVVAILREPVARAYASYWFARRRGRGVPLASRTRWPPAWSG